jgi:hypothetical protein
MSRLLSGLVLVFAVALFADDGAATKQQTAQKERLAKVQKLVGDWHGVGQPQRSSTKDSWIEEAEWAWSFGKEGPALIAKLPKAKYFSQLRISAGGADGQYELAATPVAGGEAIRYHGTLDAQEQLVFSLDQPQGELPQRLSFRFVAEGKRLVVLLERKSPNSDLFVRLAEVGYTRQGSGFGKGSTQRECVVTGGLGTIAVTHNGQTYYVCCTGCRDYFNENPDMFLAEYNAKKK